MTLKFIPYGGLDHSLRDINLISASIEKHCHYFLGFPQIPCCRLDHFFRNCGLVSALIDKQGYRVLLTAPSDS